MTIALLADRPTCSSEGAGSQSTDGNRHRLQVLEQMSVPGVARLDETIRSTLG
ncbi:MAG: hypothetical protein OER12_03990 [Acidimicrobiia bacterium]|nr:hypothetical protein [Acidimicrobiia bacterium]